MGKILVAEGTGGVKVNTPIMVLVEAGETVSDAPKPAAAAAVAATAEAPIAATAPATSAPPPPRLRSQPKAGRIPICQKGRPRR